MWGGGGRGRRGRATAGRPWGRGMRRLATRWGEGQWSRAATTALDGLAPDVRVQPIYVAKQTEKTTHRTRDDPEHQCILLLPHQLQAKVTSMEATHSHSVPTQFIHLQGGLGLFHGDGGEFVRMRDGLGVAILGVGSGALFDEIFSSLEAGLRGHKVWSRTFELTNTRPQCGVTTHISSVLLFRRRAAGMVVVPESSPLARYDL
ncbi:hypothetical protein B0H14DRAFT_3047873 [Mycena olivaceomarginata]|nr:hypothetical protein B0H14DRAFT_3047873 [Mycena olivaceomarginata]